MGQVGTSGTLLGGCKVRRREAGYAGGRGAALAEPPDVLCNESDNAGPARCG